VITPILQIVDKSPHDILKDIWNFILQNLVIYSTVSHQTPTIFRGALVRKHCPRAWKRTNYM